MTGRIVRGFAGVCAAWLLGVGVASAQAPVLTQSVSGNTLTLNWTATAGATSYRVDAGAASGSYGLGSAPVAATTLTVPGVPNGVFFLRVVALPGGESSNEVVLRLPEVPAAPANFQVARNGSTLVGMWAPGAGGGTVASYQLQAGLAAGITSFPPVAIAGTSFAAGPIPANVYYLRVVAVNAAGVSAASNEVAVTMTPGACDPPPATTLTASAFSTFLSLSWSPVPGANAYLFDVTQDGVPIATNAVVPGATTSASKIVGLATYGITARATFACGSTSAPTTTTIVVNGAPPPGNRTPDPAPGSRLPEPNYLRTEVERLANEPGDLLRNSCVETGGNNRFLFELTKRLRARDNRWGNNIKRTNQGLSQDVVTYNNSALPDEGVRTGPTPNILNMYMYDVIGGHCGPNPSPNSQEVHSATIGKGEAGQWTLQYFLAAGYTP